jgi:hypothetical protein
MRGMRVSALATRPSYLRRDKVCWPRSSQAGAVDQSIGISETWLAGLGPNRGWERNLKLEPVPGFSSVVPLRRDVRAGAQNQEQ